MNTGTAGVWLNELLDRDQLSVRPTEGKAPRDGLADLELMVDAHKPRILAPLATARGTPVPVARAAHLPWRR